MSDPAPSAIAETLPGFHLVTGAASNWVIVTAPHSAAFLMIDGGYPGDENRVRQSIEALGLDPAACEGILVTHGHVDHIGGLGWLVDEHQVPVWCHVEEAKNVLGPSREQVTLKQVVFRVGRPRIRRWLRTVVDQGALNGIGLTPSHTFTNNDVLPVLRAPRVVHSPGHTSGSSSYVFETPHGRVLVSGDALVTGHELLSAEGVPTVLPKMFSRDHEQGLRTLADLEQIQPAVILPGHGPAVWPVQRPRKL